MFMSLLLGLLIMIIFSALLFCVVLHVLFINIVSVVLVVTYFCCLGSIACVNGVLLACFCCNCVAYVSSFGGYLYCVEIFYCHFFLLVVVLLIVSGVAFITLVAFVRRLALVSHATSDAFEDRVCCQSCWCLLCCLC